MTYRPALSIRTWLDGIEYDLATMPHVLHYDLWAYVDLSGAYWFTVEARPRGRELLARTIYYVRPDGALEERRATPELNPVSWHRGTHAAFRRVHGALLRTCAALPGYTRASIHCHYLKALDVDPWPRGVLNTYRYTMARDDKRRKARPTATGTLPDVL